jgi:transcriptional regulator with XRE-family HTH domain
MAFAAPPGNLARMAAQETSLVRAIRDYIARTGDSARNLSLRIGRNETLVRRILDGTVRTPRGDNLTALAAILGCTAEALVGDRADLPAAPPPAPAPHPASAMVALACAAAQEAIAGAGPRLRATRLALHLRTPGELAAEIGARPEDVARWEAGLPPDLAALAVLKLRRGVPLDWLLLGDDTALPPMLLQALVQGGHAGLAYRGGVPRGSLAEAEGRHAGGLHEEPAASP